MESSADTQGRRRELPLLTTFVIVLVLIGSASAIFVGSYNGQRVAGMATKTQKLERTLRSIELSRVYLTQAVYLSAETDAQGTFDRAVAAASQSLDAAVFESDSYLALSSADGNDLVGERRAYVEAFGDVMGLIEAGLTSDAARVTVEELDPAYGELQRLIVDLQRADVSAINQTSSALGRIGDVVRFLLAFAVPGTGISAYRWLANRQRRAAEMRLRLETQEMINRSKDEFIANVSHELRTPLTGIVGFAQILEQSDLDPADLEVVRLIVTQSAELSCMVDDLLTAARADAESLSVQPAEVAIRDQAEEVVRFVKMMGVHIEMDVRDARVTVDPERLRQVLRNLLVNAGKHGGSRVAVKGIVRGADYVVSVVDDGPGLPSHVEERLFSRFVHSGRTPLTRGSVGLGLAIVGEICRLMDCEVSYRRLRGETRFSVTLPLAEPATAADLRETPRVTAMASSA